MGAVRKLLDDPAPAVRLKVALALASAGDAAAVPTLISLVAEGDQSLTAEDYLYDLAQETGPRDLPDGDKKRKERSQAWSRWWEANQAKEYLIGAFAAARRERSASSGRASLLRGDTLLVQPQANTVTLLGRTGKPRWTLTGLAQPRDAEVLYGGQRVLVIEQDRVTERDGRGKILWQKVVPQPVSMQRQRNGNILIVCARQLIEVSRAGKDIRKIELTSPVVAGRKLHDGRFVCFDGGAVIQLDKKGRDVKRTRVDCGGAGCNEVLDNGHVLVSSPGFGNLIEFDADGKKINQFDMSGVAHGFRLPNGHTLVTINGTKVVELDRKWKSIKETPLTTPAFRVKGR
jgi:hypothetical protein